jgi:hypothetical protein
MLRNPGGLVYGVIAIGTLLAAESPRRETYPETIGAVVVAILLYWLAHAYSEFTEHRLERSQALNLAILGRTLGHELSILGGAAAPLVAVLVCWAAGATVSTAVTAALWTSAAMILGIETVAGIRAKLTGRELAAQVGLGTVLGLLVITLRFILH